MRSSLPEIIVALRTWRFVREDEDFLEAVDAVFDRHTVPAEDLIPRGGTRARRRARSCRERGRRARAARARSARG